MTIIRFFGLLIIFPFISLINGTAQTSHLEVSILNNELPVIIHTLEEGQTIYGISKTYNLEINTLMDANPDLEPDNLKIGQDIIVPIQRGEICYLEEQCPENKNVQLIYTVKHKDNLFRISRIYFNTDISVIKKRNNIKGNNLSPGTRLRIGRISYSDYLNSYLKPEHVEIVTQVTPSEAEIPETYQRKQAPPMSSDLNPVSKDQTDDLASVQNDISLEPAKKDHPDEVEKTLSEEWKTDTKDIERIVDKNMVTEGATCYWNKNQSSKKGFFILHKSLPNNTKVQITNPVTHQTVTAKVVGNIPDNIYAPEIELVATSEVAHAIGILDKKFYARISYPKDLSMK